MTEQEIVSKTRAIMNEIGEEESLSLLSEDTIKIEEYIKSVIPDAVGIVQMNSPVRCVNKKNGLPSDKTITPNADGMCTIPLPDDYISLVAVKLSNWKRACIVSYGMDSEEYKRQCNPVTVAGTYKPVCIDGYDGEGKRILMLYSAKAQTDIETFVYEAKYTTSSGLDVDPEEPIASAVCYMAASLVYSIFENQKTAEAMKLIAINLIPK